MTRCVALLAILVAPTLLPGTSLRVQASSRLQASAVRHGVRITVSLPQRAAPRNALIKVPVQIENLTDKVVYLPFMGCGADWGDGLTYPEQVEVLNCAGTVVFPPALHFLHPPLTHSGTCSALILQPHQTRHTSDYVILRGPRVRASVIVGEFPVPTAFPKVPPASKGGYRVQTPALTVQLLKEDAPLVRVDQYQSFPHVKVAATVIPRQPVHRAMRYLGWHDCYYPGATDQIVTWNALQWVRKPAQESTAVQSVGMGTQLTPTCPALRSPTSQATWTEMVLQWHAVVGWPGHSVVNIDYPRG